MTPTIMNCQDVQRKLHDDPDSGLSEQDRREIDHHLEDCPSCRTARAEWQALSARIRALPVSAEPNHDLWPSIAREIEQHQATSSRHTTHRTGRLLLVAASTLLVVAAGLLAVRGRGGSEPSSREPLATLAQVDSTEIISVVGAADLAHHEDRTLETRRDLLVTLAHQEARLGGELSAEIATDVQSLHEAIGEIRLALQQRPDDRRLNLLLAAKFQQEANLLKRLNHI